MIPNQDLTTGIRYTVYRADSINSDLLQDLFYTHGRDLSYEAAQNEEIERQRSEWEDSCERITEQAQEAGTDIVLDDFEPNLDDFDPMIDEATYEGVYQGVKYGLNCLGGAYNLWVFESPVIGHFDLCSPCCPGACNGDSPTPRADGFVGFAAPPNWMADHVTPKPETWHREVP